MIRTIIAAAMFAPTVLLAPSSPAFAASPGTALTLSHAASPPAALTLSHGASPPTALALSHGASPPTALTLSQLASSRTALTLSYEADAGYAAAVTLRCDPPGGAHPKAADSCRTLANVDGNPSYLRPAHRYCFLIYAPITARITGKWKGARVDWSRRFANSCEMKRATGVLFDF